MTLLVGDSFFLPTNVTAVRLPTIWEVFMRTIIILILYVIITILSIPCYLIEWIIRLINPMAAAKIAQVIVKGVFNLVMFVSGCRKEIVGLERIPRDTPVMYAANHRSFYEIVLAYATVPNQTAFISKKEIKKMPCVAQWMYFLNCQFMDRDDIKQSLQVILNAIALVKEGYSIYIAPEGTATPPTLCWSLRKAV